MVRPPIWVIGIFLLSAAFVVIGIRGLVREHQRREALRTAIEQQVKEAASRRAAIQREQSAGANEPRTLAPDSVPAIPVETGPPRSRHQVKLQPDWGARAFACNTVRDCALTRIVDGGDCCPACIPGAYARSFVRKLEHEFASACQPERTDCNRCRKLSETPIRCVDHVCRGGRRVIPCACPRNDPLCDCL